MKFSARAALALLFAAVAVAVPFAGHAAAAPTAPTTNVIGGSPIDDTTYPFLLSVLRGPDPVNDFYCSGTLIDNVWAMTAAHCLASGGYVPNYVAIGSADRSSSSIQVIPVVSYYRNPTYDASIARNDVMLLRLAHAPSGGITPVTLADSGDSPTGGETVTVTGWGLTTAGSSSGTPPLVANATTLEVVANSVCQGSTVWGSLVSAGQICASHPSPTLHNACNGDSGGPMLYNGKQVGITSFGVEGCTGELPGVYTRVASYRPFIDGTMLRALGTSDTSLLFGSAYVDGGTVSKTLNYESDGSQPINVSGVTTSNSDFSVASSTCTGEINPGQTCQVTVNFDPTAGGQRSANLQVNTDSAGIPSVQSSLSGNGLARVKSQIGISLAHKKTKVVGGKLKVTYQASYNVPAGVPIASVCSGTLSSKLKVLGHSFKTRTAMHVVPSTIGAQAACYSDFTFKLPLRAAKKRAKLTLSLPANSVRTVSSVKRTSFPIR